MVKELTPRSELKALVHEAMEAAKGPGLLERMQKSLVDAYRSVVELGRSAGRLFEPRSDRRMRELKERADAGLAI